MRLLGFYNYNTHQTGRCPPSMPPYNKSLSPPCLVSLKTEDAGSGGPPEQIGPADWPVPSLGLKTAHQLVKAIAERWVDHSVHKSYFRIV